MDKPGQVGRMGVYPLYPEDMEGQFHHIKESYYKKEGKQVFHIIISFERNLNFSVNDAMEMGYMRLQDTGAENRVRIWI